MHSPTERQADTDADSVHHEEEEEDEEGMEEEEEEEEEEEGEEEDDDDDEEEDEERSVRQSLTLEADELEEDPLETAVFQLAQDVVTTEWADDELTTKLNMIAEALEEAEAAFRKDRTPPYRREGNLIGNLLQVLDQQDEFYSVLESKLGELTDIRVQAAACRVLLATVPVHSRRIVRLLYEEETLDRLCDHAADAAPPLRCYATGLLAVGLRDRSVADIVVNKEASLKFLQRIRLYASKMERERAAATKYIHERTRAHRRRAMSVGGTSVRNPSSTQGAQRSMAGLKRKFSETTLRAEGESTSLDDPSLDEASGDGASQPPVEDTDGGDGADALIQSADILQFQPDPERHEEELKRLVMLELLYTLDCLGLMGEYMELFAPALKEDILGTIITFLHSPNATVVNHAMKLTSHFLAHKKFCFLMLDAGGIDLILATAKAMHGTSQLGFLDQSLSMCLHGIASSTAVMEKVLAGDAETLLLVSFRLLTSANDRARLNGVVFFGLTLVFKVVLEYFEKEQGVYHLLNIIRVGNNPKSAVQRQLSHDACLCLRQYLRVHLALVTHRLRRRLALLSHPTNARSATSATGTPVLTAAPALSRLPVRVPKLQASKPVDIDDKAHEQNLVFYEKYQFSVPGSGGASGPGGAIWAPAAKLSHLRGPLVMLEVVAMMVALLQNGEPEETANAVRVWIVERAQFCLECLRVVTLVVPSLASDVCSTEVVMDEGGTLKMVGLSILLELAMSSNGRDSALVRDALHVFCNCVSPPHSEECWQHPHKDIRQFTLTARDMRRQQTQASSSGPQAAEEESVVTCCPRVKDDKAQRPVRKLARAKNAIKVCVHLLRYKRSVQNADAIRLLATRALLGLSRDRHIAQILEKMQLGQLLSDLIRQDPVLEENADLHVRFRESALDLISLVTHRAPNAVINEATDPTVRKIEKASIVAQTPITYDPNELLGLIHSHLVAKGLTETAAALVRESRMDAVTPSGTSFKTPEKAARPKQKHRGPPVDIATTASARHHETDGPRPSKISKLVLNPIETAKSQLEDTSMAEPVLPTVTTTAVVKLPHGERRKRVRRAFLSPHLFGSSPQPPPRSHKAIVSDPVTTAPKHGPQRTSTNSSSADIPDQKPESSRLDEIITHYLREQHRQCVNPVTTVPPFKLLSGTHRCPDPSTLIKTPVNICSRLFERSRSGFRMGPRALAATAYADAGVNRYVFSRYRPSRIVGNTTPHWGPSVVRFYGDDQRELLMGNHDGLVLRQQIDTDQLLDEWTCHTTSSAVVDLETNESTRMAQANRVLLTGSVALTSFGISEVAVWDVNAMHSARWRFAGALAPRFNHYGDRIVALDARLGDDVHDIEGDRQVVGAVVLDLATGAVLSELKDSVQSNDYGKDTNCCFAPDDSTILTGGMLWDARIPTRALYKFDKLSNIGYGFFHPNGNEVIINSAVWDLRTYQLLRMVPALDKCTVRFNGGGSVLFAYSPHSVGGEESEGEGRRRPKAKTWFRVLDARDYKDISTVELQRPLYDLAVDGKSTVLATIEGRYLDAATSTDDDPVCRLYEIGRKKPSEDDSDVEEGQGENGSEAMDEDEFDNESDTEEEEEDDEEDEDDDEDDEEEDEDDEEMEEEYESDEYDDEEDGDEDDAVGGSEEEGEEESGDDAASDDEAGSGLSLSARDIQMLFELPQGDYYTIHDDYSGDEEDDDE